jgi:hypothetical protein
VLENLMYWYSMLTAYAAAVAMGERQSLGDARMLGQSTHSVGFMATNLFATSRLGRLEVARISDIPTEFPL